jgi:hypothetical protein
VRLRGILKPEIVVGGASKEFRGSMKAIHIATIALASAIVAALLTFALTRHGKIERAPLTSKPISVSVLPPWSIPATRAIENAAVTEDWPDRSSDTRIEYFHGNDQVVGAVVQRVLTVAGLAEVRNGCDKNESLGTPCQSLIIGGRRVHEDFGVQVTTAYPTTGTPEFLIVRSSSGGNCCAPAVVFLDLSKGKPLKLDDIQLRGAITITDGSARMLKISGLNAKDTDDRGDPVISTYLYYTDHRILIAAPYDRHTNFSDFAGQYANDLLSDTNFRRPVLAAL